MFAGWWVKRLKPRFHNCAGNGSAFAGLHIDSYRCIDHVDGHCVEVVEQTQDLPVLMERLWFVNLGRPHIDAEQHHFGVIVAFSSIRKSKARQRWRRPGTGAQGLSSPDADG